MKGCLSHRVKHVPVPDGFAGGMRSETAHIEPDDVDAIPLDCIRSSSRRHVVAEKLDDAVSVMKVIRIINVRSVLHYADTKLFAPRQPPAVNSAAHQSPRTNFFKM